MKIYTKTGDKGQTSLFDGSRVDKDSLRVEAYGTVDELNSTIGLASNFVEDAEIKKHLLGIQKILFFVAGQLATVEKSKFKYVIRETDILNLEKVIDTYLAQIEQDDYFIVTGTSKGSAYLHVARTVCRRAERRILTLKKHEEADDLLIKYVNRLSDTLYTLARYLEKDKIIMDFAKVYKDTEKPI